MSLPKMQELLRKTEKKSPFSGHENNNSEEEDLPEKKTQKLRPITSAIDQKRLKKNQTRPITPPKQSIPFTKPQKPSESTFLSKTRQRIIISDKEKLYEENLSLKQKINNLTEELLKLKTKIFQIEKELNRKDDFEEKIPVGSSSHHLLKKLKLIIKDLKTQAAEKDQEIENLKKSLKLSRVTEIEIEMKAYIDECTRLKHHLEEIMKQKDPIHSNSNLFEKNIQQFMLSNSLKKENHELSSALVARNEEISKLKLKIQENEHKKKKSGQRKGNTHNLKQEIQKLKELLENTKKFSEKKETDTNAELFRLKKQAEDYENNQKIFEKKIKEYLLIIESLSQEVKIVKKDSIKASLNQQIFNVKKKKNPPKFLLMLNSIVQSKKMIFGVFLSLIDKNNIGIIDTEEFVVKIRKFCEKFNKKLLDPVLSSIEYKRGIISLNKLEQLYDEYDYNNYNLDDSEESGEIGLELLKNFNENKNFFFDNKSNEIIEKNQEILDFEIKVPVVAEKNENHLEKNCVKDDNKNIGNYQQNLYDSLTNVIIDQENEIYKEKINIENIQNIENIKNLEDQRSIENIKNINTSDKTEANKEKILENKLEKESKLEAKTHSPEQKFSDRRSEKKDQNSEKSEENQTDLKELLRHIYFRLQLNRIPK